MFQFNRENFATEEEYKEYISSRFHGACWLGHLDKIKNIVSQDLQHMCNITDALLAACEKGKLDVVKYLLTTDVLKKDINTYVPYEVGTHFIPSGLLLRAYYSQHMNVVDFLLYDVKYEVCRDTKNFLKFHQHEDLLQRIEKRDLFFKLNSINDGLPSNNFNKNKNKI